MAQVKLTVTRGKPNLKDITVAAGTAIAGSDAMELNVDFTKMTRGDAMVMIDNLRAKIFNLPWPMA
ncbi:MULTISPECIES: hypothetical protein [unclassified Sphingomonas]|uniref:hypothetical protein n=1 Tax=unclassified Sphingomonas TaxID=196159 RepID=UPI0009280E86|nr:MULTISPECIES: hypothetical protein [unclassified Sphingomonas]MBN8848156.1 hypothetical protein [Sphingomonas sp.]OJV30651.1 MAG: hypothetical protein BGO24_08020 [Sphingomonas sp. 67-36]